jgi:hypothetical protein
LTSINTSILFSFLLKLDILSSFLQLRLPVFFIYNKMVGFRCCSYLKRDHAGKSNALFMPLNLTILIIGSLYLGPSYHCLLCYFLSLKNTYINTKGNAANTNAILSICNDVNPKCKLNFIPKTNPKYNVNAAGAIPNLIKR